MGIDWTKPIELVDGTPAKFLRFDKDGDPIVWLPKDEDLDRIEINEDSGWSYGLDGTVGNDFLPDIRNVVDHTPEPVINDTHEILRALLTYSEPKGLMGQIAREAAERVLRGN